MIGLPLTHDTQIQFCASSNWN